MAKQNDKKPEDFIVPLNMNGLNGRMLRLPPPKGKRREILFVYGQHSSLERWWGLVMELNKYGGLTCPDLPGYGGMDSFYKIGRTPTMDNMADYLAAFIKLRYKNRRVTIAGMSVGFAIVTRMLQRYPELVKRVDLLVSIVGFAHHEDFVFSKPRVVMYKTASRFFALKAPAWVFQHIFLHPAWLRRAYHHSRLAKQKFEGKEADEFTKTMDAEVLLWSINDIRTQMFTNVQMFTLDNCQKQVDLPVWHVDVSDDRYFDHRIVEQHFRVIFNDFKSARSKVDNHAPSIIADAKTAAPYVPRELRRALSKT